MILIFFIALIPLNRSRHAIDFLVPFRFDVFYTQALCFSFPVQAICF